VPGASALPGGGLHALVEGGISKLVHRPGTRRAVSILDIAECGVPGPHASCSRGRSSSVPPSSRLHGCGWGGFGAERGPPLPSIWLIGGRPMGRPSFALVVQSTMCICIWNVLCCFF
jgi:hypothetical protein